jgi:hypothetical protein
MALPPAVAWRLDEAVLLTLEDGAEIALLCRCGRHHWGVAEVAGALHLTCHGCGTRREFAFHPTPRPRGGPGW